MKTPVVFLVFNRPQLTEQVFAQIRTARPAKLLVVCDGPRGNQPGDVQKVAAVRALIDAWIDWPCELLRNYAETNLGCRTRISSGLTWAFAQVDEAIILEDDCLPDPSFFWFCETMLERYRDEPRVMHVSGSNFSHRAGRSGQDYFYSRYPTVWGWATWARAWYHYRLELDEWDEAAIDSLFPMEEEAAYWRALLPQLKSTHINTWDYQWLFSIWRQRALSVAPPKNLVQNIGFGPHSTHTFTGAGVLNRRSQGISQRRLRPPPAIKADARFDADTFSVCCLQRDPRLHARVISRLRRIARNVMR